MSAMITNVAPKNESPQANQKPLWSFAHSFRPAQRYSSQPMRLLWEVYQDSNPAPMASGQVDYLAFATRLKDLLKLERQHRERLAGVSLDPTAQKLLNVLDRETSVRWDELSAKTECIWGEASRSAALLVGANLCEVSPTRIRLNEYGDKLLAEAPSADEANREVGS